MKPFSPHAKFFSSLKQVEKRLKSEHDHSTTQISTPSSTADLSAPLYLYPSCDQSDTAGTQDSNPPLEFFSHHSPSDDSVPDPRDNVNEEIQEREKDGIQEVIEQLGLLDLLEKGEAQDECCGVGSFYSKIVGVKGPKNEKEMERLDGWIKYYLSGNSEGEDGGVKEPLRLVHLLIGKAVAIANEKEDDGGLGDLEFPSTVQEFLEHDPPTLLS